MNRFLLALQFLTLAPVKTRECRDSDLATSLIFFPLVGLLLGLALWCFLSTILTLGLGSFAAVILTVVLLAGLTGAMHLDGLADTADGFFSGKPKDSILEIMRDPHTGSMGAAALICALLIKIALLSAVPAGSRGIALIVACVCGRWPAVLSIWLFPYARKEGKASGYFSAMNGSILLAAGAIALACVLVAGSWKGIVVLAGASVFVIWMNLKIKQKIGGITGDTLGAGIELAEIFALLLSALLF